MFHLQVSFEGWWLSVDGGGMITRSAGTDMIRLVRGLRISEMGTRGQDKCVLGEGGHWIFGYRGDGECG